MGRYRDNWYKNVNSIINITKSGEAKYKLVFIITIIKINFNS